MDTVFPLSLSWSPYGCTGSPTSVPSGGSRSPQRLEKLSWNFGMQWFRTVTSQQAGIWVGTCQPTPVFLCGDCLVSLCLCGFLVGSSHWWCTCTNEPHLSPNVSWDWLQPQHDTQRTSGMNNGWLDIQDEWTVADFIQHRHQDIIFIWQFIICLIRFWPHHMQREQHSHKLQLYFMFSPNLPACWIKMMDILTA